MHQEVYTYVARITRDLTARRLNVVELGSRDVNGSVRPLFEGCDYTGVDIARGPGVDIVADGATWQPDGEPFDVGLCLEVLEHAPEPTAIVANLRRIVKPGGIVIVTAATDPRAPHSGTDGAALRAGEYYANVPAWALLTWLDGCPYVSVEVDLGHGDVRALARVGP